VVGDRSVGRGTTGVPAVGCTVLSIRRMTLRSGYRYLMESVAAGDGMRHQSISLTDYYVDSGTPAGVFLGAGLAALDGGAGVEIGSEVTEQNLFNLLGMCADPITGEPLGRPPIRPGRSARGGEAGRSEPTGEVLGSVRGIEPTVRVEVQERANTATNRTPVAGFDLTFSPSKSISTAWALADADTKATISACHRRAIEVVLTYAERKIFHSRSGKNGLVQEDVEGVVATAFTHWDSRAGDPQLHDHVVVANRARSISDGQWRTLDSRGLFKSVVMLGELHQGVLADLLTQELGWDWDERSRRHSDQVRWEVSGVPETLLAEFSQRAAAIEERKEVLIPAFVAAHGRQPTTTEIIKLRQRATLETRPLKEHRPVEVMADGWRQRAEHYVGSDPEAWVAALSDRNDLPQLRSGDLADEILADAASVTIRKVSERRATFSRANVLAEVHRQFHGVRFASPEDRIAVAERTADLAAKQSLLISAPELHFTPKYLRRADGTSRFRAKGHEIYTTPILIDAESRLLDAGREINGPAVATGTVAAVTSSTLPGRSHPLSIDQALAVEQVATSGRRLDLVVGPAGTGKSTTMAGLRAAWEAEHGATSVLGLAPSAAAAEVLAEQLGIDTENTAKWLHEHRQQAERLEKITGLRAALRSPATSRHRSALKAELVRVEDEVARWNLRADQLVIVDEASLVGTFAVDELVAAARDARAKVVLVGDPAQLSAIEAGGMFAALVRDRDGLAAELTDVRRFVNPWEKTASIELRVGSLDAIGTYESHGRVVGGSRDEVLDALYEAWKEDVEEGKNSLMIAADLGTVGELNTRAQADRIAAGIVSGDRVAVAGGARAGIGDQVVTRQNNRRLSTGKHWVRNGDQWRVIGSHADGSLRLQRRYGTGKVHVPAGYVREHVELAYASTAHRAQGRTVETAHAMVGPMTTREVLYVSATRGKEANRLYVDTHYDPDPHSSHDEALEPMTTRGVLSAVLRNEGAEVAAHDVIRREQHEAEGMERLSAEYLTLATEAQAERWEALLARAGLSDGDLAAVAASAARGPLFAGLRDAEARGLHVDAALPQLVAGKSLADAADVAAVLHGRVDRWSQAAGGKRRHTGHLIAGLIPRAHGVTDPDLARAMAERDQAMEQRALSLAEKAMTARHGWVRPLGAPPSEPSQRARWMREVATVAAYRDRWHIEGQRSLGAAPDRQNVEQTSQRKRALAAGERAKAISARTMDQRINPGLEPRVEIAQGVEM
jgi:conjugative relaxase-like TrwC/TraI family protein